ncbi:MAG: hypothetical protein AB7I19_08760 [Planctomycetota bacterium]
MTLPPPTSSSRVVLRAAAFALLLLLSYLAGRGSDPLSAQDRPGPTPRPTPPPVVNAPKTESAPLVYGEDGGSAAAANGILAVTGSYGVGTSVLYVIDTVNKQLAVYEARGGSDSMRRVTLVGARRIDLDLQIEGYNDESEYSYSALSERFGKAGRRAIEPRRSGTAAPAERR